MIGGKMSRKTRQTFTQDFKLEAAQLVLDQNYSVREAASAMNIGKSTMDKWVRQLKDERNGGSSLPNALTPDQQKIKELEKKIRQIEEEKEILKKATALLMSDSMRGSR